MCLIALAYRHFPDLPLVMIANRDEFYARETAPLHKWTDTPISIIAGRDMQEGGTWMGISEKGHIAALTNFRDPAHMQEGKPSRGKITQEFLSGNTSIAEMPQYLRTRGRSFNGFNLLFGTIDEMYYYNNVEDRYQQLYPGIYGLSNAFLDTPWPKVQKVRELIANTRESPDADAWITAMQNAEEAPDALLPATGVSPEWEKKLSAMFITSETYGTRLTTFVSIDRHNKVLYREVGYQPKADITFTFQIQP